MSLYKRGTFWWSRIVRNGERLDRSTKCKSKAEAQRVEARWHMEINDAGDTLQPLSKIREQRRPTTLSHLALKMWPALESKVAPRTLEYYKQAMAPLTRSKLGGYLLHNITLVAIEEFMQERLEDVGPASVNGSLRTLRRGLRMAEEWKMIPKAPKIKLLPGEHQRDYVITDAVLTKLLAHVKCTPLLRDLVPFLIDTGLRISEALALTWEDVGLEPKRGADRGWILVRKGKTRYARRHVPLTERARGILTRIKKEVPKNEDGILKVQYVFPDMNGEQMTRHWPSEQFRTLRDAMRLPKDAVVHSTRHTFCTRLGEAGVDAFSLQRLAGHSSITISQRYVHPTPALLESAIGKLSVVTQ